MRGFGGGRGVSACDHTNKATSESDETSQYNENKLSRRQQQQKSGEEGAVEMKGRGAGQQPRGEEAFSLQMNPTVLRNFDTCFPIAEGHCWEKRFRGSNPRCSNKTKGQGEGGGGR